MTSETTTPDEADETPAGGGEHDNTPVRRCEFCQQELPPQTGKARRRRWCPDGQGKYVATVGDCGKLGPAWELVAPLMEAGIQPVLEGDLEHLARLLEPLHQLSQALAAVDARLDGSVIEAGKRQQLAEVRAQTAERRAQIAEDDRAEFERAAREATERMASALRDADDALSAAAAAQRAQRDAETKAAAANERARLNAEWAERAENAEQRARQEADEQRAKNVMLAAELDTERKLRAAADQDVENERSLRERFEADTDRRVEQLQADHTAALTRTEKRTNELAAALAQREREHADQVVSLQSEAAAKDRLQTSGIAHIRGLLTMISIQLDDQGDSKHGRQTQTLAVLLGKVLDGEDIEATELDEDPADAGQE
jgi:hypothetical protein